jgi:hypothetical protein
VFLKPASVLKTSGTGKKVFYRPSTDSSLMELDIMETELGFRERLVKEESVKLRSEFIHYLLNEFEGDTEAVKSLMVKIDEGSVER